jgi:hypothetical protein
LLRATDTINNRKKVSWFRLQVVSMQRHTANSERNYAASLICAVITQYDGFTG